MTLETVSQMRRLTDVKSQKVPIWNSKLGRIRMEPVVTYLTIYLK